ncbi:hypothetical protein RHDC1_00474 [Rhodocyclaceae bacterium]|nr:hypothetical protein RHDC1_00474 [Rhodocyclaceae bacterium]
MSLMRSRLFALAAALFAGAAHAQSCPEPAVWTLPGGERPRVAAATALLDDMAQRDVVLLGETHDEMDHHRWQLQTLAALHARRPDMVIGFEMFPRRVQPVLDRWVAGELTVAEFLDQAEWERNWNMPAELYLPLFQFARINRIPMLALNIERKLSRAISEKGWDAVAEAEREGVGRPAAPVEAYREQLFAVFREHPTLRGKGDKPKQNSSAFRFFVESQTVWDRAMAEALARRALAGRPLVAGVMGSGHLRFGHGVPHQLRDLGIRNIGILLPLSPGGDCREIRAGLADAVFMLPAQAQARPEPPRLGVQLEAHEGGVRIVAVTAGSLAEKSGLKGGDRIVEMAGRPVQTTLAAISLVRLQPAGTWLPLRVRRGAEMLDLVVKFPPAKP